MWTAPPNKQQYNKLGKARRLRAAKRIEGAHARAVRSVLGPEDLPARLHPVEVGKEAESRTHGAFRAAALGGVLVIR